MATLDDLVARRDTLLERITSLQKRVTYGDRTVEYDQEQAKAALNLLDAEIARCRSNGIVRHVKVMSKKDL